MGFICRSMISTGAEGAVIDIECHVSNNLPTIVIVGFASKTVYEAKDRLRAAFASSQLKLPRRRITLNLAPAEQPKTDSSLDLAMAAAILRVSHQIEPLGAQQALVGELGLDGSVRPVRGIIGKLLAGREHKLSEFFIPEANLQQAQLIPGITLFPVMNLRQLHAHLIKKQPITPVITGTGRHSNTVTTMASNDSKLDDVIGQEEAKRAITIAAAGGHNIFLCGPPGTGKSMLAKSLISLLPPLHHEEILEVTHLSSLASNNYEQLITERPLRSPHHSTSHTAMIGGANLRPGEISLSHRGVLLLDELPEFSRPTLEALRQPLEDRSISIARAKATLRFPANFILVGTANPCPCGFYGTVSGVCICSAALLQRYRTKLSGPIFDRIDLYCEVAKVDHQALLSAPLTVSSSTDITDQISAARERQAKRYGSATVLNADLDNADLRQYARITPMAVNTLNNAGERFGLSARAYLRTVKVARTIADLEGASDIQVEHVSEAIHYRQSGAKSSV
jgi:magnesium chelatase family protein